MLARSARRSAPCMPCSRNTTPAICGLSRGAKNTNQPWSRTSILPFVRRRAPGLRDHLRRPGLAADVLARRCARGRRCRPPLTTTHRPSRIACELLRRHLDLRLRRRRRHRLQPLPVVHRLEQVRRDARAAVGEGHHLDRQRDRRDRHLPLADRRPRSSRRRTTSSRCCSRLPLGRRHQPLHLVRQVDAGLHAEAEQRRPLVDPIDAEHVADGVEVDVARLLDRVAQVDRAVARPSSSTRSSGRRRSRRRAQCTLEVRRDDPFLERRRGRPPS